MKNETIDNITTMKTRAAYTTCIYTNHTILVDHFAQTSDKKRHNESKTTLTTSSTTSKLKTQTSFTTSKTKINHKNQQQ